LTVILHHDRDLTTDAFQQKLTPLLNDVPDVRFFNRIGFVSAGITVVLAGEDGPALERAQQQLLREMRTVKSISNPRPTPPPPGPELVVTPRPAEAARLNVDSRTLAQVLRIATIGDIDANVAKYSEGERRLPIRVRLPESARTQLDVIRNLQVPTLDGQTTPLISVADIDFQAGPGQILNRKRIEWGRSVSVRVDMG